MRILLAGLVGLLAWWVIDRLLVDRRPIVVGLLHSLTGIDAPVEKILLDAEIAALTEINANGGLLGRPIRWEVADGGSDAQAFARQAARLIRDEGACVLVGCWGPGGRKSVIRVVEANDHLLIYPGRYEGLEQSPNVMYTGPVPSQLVGPGVRWLREETAAERFFLVEADDLWGRAVVALAEDLLGGLGCAVVGRALIADEDDITAAVAAIVASRPDAVISTLEWPGTADLSRALRSAGVRPESLPVLALPRGTSLVPARESIAGVATAVVAGPGLAAGSGPPAGSAVSDPPTDRPTTEAAAGATSGIRLWAQAVRDADTTDVRQVRDAMRHQSIATPDGIIAVDPGTQHTWHRVTVARIRSDGRLDAVSGGTAAALRPVPYPMTRSRAQWDQLAAALFRRWGGSWVPPRPPARTALPPPAAPAAGAPR